MTKVNFKAINEIVHTQYGDLTGVIKLDGHSNISSIYELCKANGFDTNDKFIIGFGLGESTVRGIGKKNQVTCSILYVDKNEYGNNYDEIETKIKRDDSLKLKKKSLYISYTDLGKYIKRFSFMAASGLTKHTTTIEVENVDEN